MNTKPAKNSLLSSMSRKKLGVLIASFIVFMATLSILTFEGTKNTVALTVDGEKVIIKTHAKTIGDVLHDLNVDVKDTDFLSHSVETRVKDQLNIIWEPAILVKVRDGKDHQSVWTTAKTVNELLNIEEIYIDEHDEINVALIAPIQSNMEVEIERAIPLTLINGKKKKEEVWTTSTTVADFLEQQGIKLGKLDRVEPDLKEGVEAKDEIKVIRVEKVTDVVEEPIDFAVVTKKDSSLSKGMEKVVREGKEGLLEKEYEITKENGKEVARKFIKEKTIRDSSDKVVAVGTKVLVAQVSRGQAKASASPAKSVQPKAAAVTNVSTKVATSTSNEASNAGKEMYVEATAYTAYCNGCSGTTATGIDLRANPNQKVIAVDPNVIPLGSKVWVEGYGHAIAGDTGGAIKGNRIDLFVPSKEQAYKFGRKKVKIRVLN
ncbi:G5 and 3D domain-containing protein [Pseudogracilibacillus auburnensis]|uniref:G5 and 3D domain-containing protein n=1 Tax=Pseudogracilibacillus auburnensis TaxID=1494959 RepID=UPI001A96F4F1|nr:G5 and 3D domain-containing protein [Pseudogracilibacillus auburnensis]MBO1004734.1 DUF348 domain-containing protein [Pseudogracilibacillus auburnensis]